MSDLNKAAEPQALTLEGLSDSEGPETDLADAMRLPYEPASDLHILQASTKDSPQNTQPATGSHFEEDDKTEPVSPDKKEVLDKAPVASPPVSQQTPTPAPDSQEVTEGKAKAASEKSESEKRETEFTNLLLEAMKEKQCAEHQQPIQTICTDYNCPRRFWCGICCVKNIDLMIRHKDHMSLISEFLSKNISKLYRVKTFSELDKQAVDSQLDSILAKSEADFKGIWEQIDGDIEAYKNEIVNRLDQSKQALKERFNKSVVSMKKFYGDLKARVEGSKTRDIGEELEKLKEQVQSGQISSLEVIETIGSKVNVDFQEVDSLNYEFNKSRDFVEYVHGHYESVRDQTAPTYSPMGRHIEMLGEKVESLSLPRIKATLEDPKKELNVVLQYYQTLLEDNAPVQQRSGLMDDYLRSQHDTLDMIKDQLGLVKDGRDEGQAKGRVFNERRGQQNPTREQPDRRTGTINAERGGDSAAAGRLAPIGSHIGRSTANHTASGSTPKERTQQPMYSSFPAPQLISSEQLDLSERSLPQTQDGYFDGSLLPQDVDADLEAIDRYGILPQSEGGKDFVSVLYLFNNSYLFSSFQKSVSSYCFRVTRISDSDSGRPAVVFTSENLFMTPNRIVNLTVLERDSDRSPLLCVNTEDGFVYIFKFLLEDDVFKGELENTISSKVYEGLLTSMLRLAHSDYLVCTTNIGHILAFDTVKGELVAKEKRMLG